MHPDLMREDNKRNNAKMKKEKRPPKRKPREKEDIVEYDFTNHIYKPNVTKEKSQLQAPSTYQPPHKSKSTVPSAPIESQVPYSTVPGIGMVYPTNHPNYPYEVNSYPHFRDEDYNPDFYDPFDKTHHDPSRNYKEYPNNVNSYRDAEPRRERAEHDGMGKNRYKQ